MAAIIDNGIIHIWETLLKVVHKMALAITGCIV
jgi:hypothetical protein